MESVADEDGNLHFYEKGFKVSEFAPWLAPYLSDSNDYRLGDALSTYLNQYEIRREFHIPSTIQQWRACEMDFDFSYKIQVEGSTWIYPLLKANGYKILVYSGDTDGTVPTYGTMQWITGLNWKVEKDWHAWYLSSGSNLDQMQV
jgi:hypothetical protein